MDGSIWNIATWGYVVVAVISAIPVAWLFISPPKPEAISPDIDEHPTLSQEGKGRVASNYRRIAGSLGFWKLKAEQNRRLTTYVAWWAIPSSILIAIISQASDSEEARTLVTTMAAYSAILLTMAQRLKAEVNFRAYREGESAFYDTFRALMDDPKRFGETEEEQLSKYFKEVESIRKRARDGELASLAKLEN